MYVIVPEIAFHLHLSNEINYVMYIKKKKNSNPRKMYLNELIPCSWWQFWKD